MLTVIIDARAEVDRLPALLAQLTAGAVDGIVRQVSIVAPPGALGVDDLCEETGAEAYPSLEAAAGAARAEWLLVLPADFRLRDGWIGSLKGDFERKAAAALVKGISDAGLFGRKPFGVLVERGRVADRQGADLKGLRRELGLNPRRVG